MIIRDSADELIVGKLSPDEYRKELEQRIGIAGSKFTGSIEDPLLTDKLARLCHYTEMVLRIQAALGLTRSFAKEVVDLILSNKDKSRLELMRLLNEKIEE